MTEFFDKAINLLKIVDSTNQNEINKVSDFFEDCIAHGGIIYMFGCGHSGLIAEDCFYRAGGLANVQPIFVPELMLHISASESSKKEKNEENAKKILDGYTFNKHDVLCVFSLSGINGAPVEIARQGKEKGLNVVGIGSSEYFDESSRHSSGKRLVDFCDVFLDNKVPKGDAIIELKNGSKAVPVSTIVSSCLIQACIAETMRKSEEKGVALDFFGSGNLSANTAKNADLVKRYQKRIKHL